MVPEVIPVFTELLARHDLTRSDCLVYGAYCELGPDCKLGLGSVAKLLSMDRDHVLVCLRRLRQAGLVHHARHGGRGRFASYRVLGPKPRK